MIDPLSETSWKADGKCYDLGHNVENNDDDRVLWDSFFGETVDERKQAQQFCDDCPVRQRCLRFALETQQLWGVWGGRDESEIRRDLWMNSNGTIGARARWPRCPDCKGSPESLTVTNSAKHQITCSECGFSWRSETTRMGVEENRHDIPKAS